MKSFLCLLGMCSSLAYAEETLVPMSAQMGMNVTIYNENRALVKDERRVNLAAGLNELAFQGVSAQMMPQTALLKGNGISTLEQNFNFDLLNSDSMLKKSVGQKVTTEYIDPATGKAVRKTAKLVAYNNGRPVLKIDDQIETDYPGRIIFDSVPANLRAEPTLSVMTMADVAGVENLTLNYLTSGLSWKADYVARLNADENKMDLNGFVTLTNNSGADYKQALLQLVAGDVNVVREYSSNTRAMQKEGLLYAAVDSKSMAPEALTDFYIYTVPHKTDLLSNQTKQVALLSAADIGVQKTYELNRPFSVYYSEQKGMKPDIYVTFENAEKNRLGQPLPKGVVRLYKEDLKGNVQFVGEDRINHTADKEMVRLRLGTSFNLSADMKRITFKKLSDKLQVGTYEVTFKNGSDMPTDVQLVLGFPDDFKLSDESQKGEHITSNDVKWVVSVPAKGESKLTFKVQF